MNNISGFSSKKLISILGSWVLGFGTWNLELGTYTLAQSPQGINYQAVARNSSGTPLATQTISVQFKIYKTDFTLPANLVYTEIHSNIVTNQFGLFTLAIGAGTTTDNFSAIAWGSDIYFLQVFVDGNDMGATQFLSVPYALHANTADSLTSGASGWLLTGNDGTNPATDFIGTKDSVPFNIKVNGQKAGKIDPAGSVFLGMNAGNSNTAITNTGIGDSSLTLNTAGVQNVAIGGYTLTNNTGSFNTVGGFGSLYLNTIGTHNTANGSYSLRNNSKGKFNTAVGSYALFSNTTAGQNIAIGYQALYSQIFDNSNSLWYSDNVAIGVQALYANQPSSTGSGVENTAVGNYALKQNVIGIGNTAMGMERACF